MKNKYLILRHAETVKDSNVHPKDWLLTPDALTKISEYISTGKFDTVTKIVSSTESKAIATGKPISEYLKLPIIEMEEFVEVKREKKFLTDAKFLDQKKRELTNLDTVENDTESANEALKRFESGIAKLESENSSENILIITHGTMMSLYLAKQENNLQDVFTKWSKLQFCELVNLN